MKDKVFVESVKRCLQLSFDEWSKELEHEDSIPNDKARKLIGAQSFKEYLEDVFREVE